MNIHYFKYAVEIAKTKSISKAADNLFMGQPNLSRAIKELEKSLGITIFRRTTQGISVTAEGEEFLQYAKRIVAVMDEVEGLYQNVKTHHQKFSACVPRASYIAYAFAEFAKHIQTDHPADIFYKETNSLHTIENVVRGDYNLGIIRYQSTFDKYFKTLFEEKSLVSEVITEYNYVLLVSKKSPLAFNDDILLSDLADYIEITHADPYVPSLQMVEVKKAELSEFVDKRIFVFERASQFVLLESVPTTFMWVSPIPEMTLEKYGLVQKTCKENSKLYKDVLIYRKGYKLTDLDNQFITDVCNAKRKYL